MLREAGSAYTTVKLNRHKASVYCTKTNTGMRATLIEPGTLYWDIETRASIYWSCLGKACVKEKGSEQHHIPCVSMGSFQKGRCRALNSTEAQQFPCETTFKSAERGVLSGSKPKKSISSSSTKFNVICQCKSSWHFKPMDNWCLQLTLPTRITVITH